MSRSSFQRGFALAFATAALACAFVAGCGGGSIGKQGEVRLVNAAGGAGPLDLYAGDARIASGVADAGYSGYASVEAGSPTLAVRLASSGASLASAAPAVEKDKRYTVLAYTSGGAVAETVLADTEGAPTGDSAKLRVFNTASVEAGTLDAYLSATDCTALAASNAVATGLGVSAPGAYATFGASSAGTPYHLCITGSGDTSDLRLDLPLTLVRQQVTTVVLAATAGGVLVDALLVEQQGAVTARRNASARLRLVADAAARASVAATVNRVVLSAGTASPLVGAYVTVPAGATTASVSIGGAAVAFPVQALAAGSDLTLLVAGSAATPTVRLITDDNRRPASTVSAVRLRLVHGLNGLGDALTLDANARRVATDVAFGTASAPANVGASSAVVLDVTAPSVTGSVYNASGTAAVTLLANGVYTLFVLGDAGTPVARLSQDR